MSQYTIQAGTGQHIGDREEQQDRVAILAAPKAPGYVMAVLADGMGGRSGGAMAAEQVIQTAKMHFETFSPASENLEDMLNSIGREAHTIIKLSGLSADKEPHSTMVVVVFTPEKEAMWAHVGDSRLYRFEGPNFVEHTIDHSFVEKLVSEGKLTRQDAKSHRLSNILVNVLGSTATEPFITIGRCQQVKAGSAFLLCSDGLLHYFTEGELGAAIAMNTPREASEMLIKKTRERSVNTKADNCTFAIVKFVTPEEAPKDYVAKKMRRAV